MSSRHIVRRNSHHVPAIHSLVAGKCLQDTLSEGPGSSKTSPCDRERASRHIVRRNWQQQYTFLVGGKGFRAHRLKEQPPAIHIPCDRERASRRIVRRKWLQQHTSLWQGKGYNFKTHCPKDLAPARHHLVEGKGFNT